MINRRHALKTIAGATVVGSLSGCVQLATQRTTHFHGTPATVSLGDLDGDGSVDAVTANAVGVEARKTIERFGVTKEIVTHNWGMLYSGFGAMGREGTSVNIEGVNEPPSQVVTFSTPSIEIAGRELNPVKELTVDEIAKEFLSIMRPTNGPNEEHRSLWGQSEYEDLKEVSDATGKKVLRAFRDSVRSPSAEYQPPSLDASASGGTLSTVPDWDGDTYDGELTWSTGAGDAGTHTASIHFEKHDGDFVVLFSTAAESIKTELRGDYGSSNEYASYVHPPDDEFNREVLRRHLLETNLRGAQGLVEQGRKLTDETKGLLAEIDGEAVGSDTLRAISDTRDDLKRLDTVMGRLAEGLSSISTKTVTTDENGDWSANIERAQTATEIAKRAHERVASNNDTRNEEDDRFVQIERNLDGLMRVSQTIHRTLANGRKTVKAEDV